MGKSQQQTGHRLLTLGATTAIAASAVLAATTLPAYAAAVTITTPQVAAVTGGTVVRLTGTGLALTTSYGARFVPSTVVSCPTLYSTVEATAVNGGVLSTASSTLATITAPAGLVAGTSYKICLYVNATTGGAAADSSTDTVTAVNMAAQSTTVLRAAASVTLTAPSAVFGGTGYASQLVNNATTSCPTTLTAPVAPGPPAYITAGATAKVVGSNSQITVAMPAATTFVAGTPYLICTYATATAGAALVARSRFTLSTLPADLPAVTLSPTGGSSGIATTVTQVLPTGSTLFATAPDVLLTQLACPNTRPATATFNGNYTAGTVTRIANNKVAVTIPTSTLVFPQDVTTPWNLCTYVDSTTGAALVTQPAIYSVAPVLGVNSALFSSASGPAQGNSVVTITSLSGIPTAEGALLTARLGNAPLTITGKTATSITGTTSASAPGPVKLSVTTAAGTKTTTINAFTYTYGITVTPNSAPSATTPIVDILGAGFGSLTFGDVVTGTVLADDTAYVFLTDNAWNNQTFTPTTGINAFDAPPVSYCNTVLPISDNEIICALNLTAKLDAADVVTDETDQTPTITTADVPPGAYTLTVVNRRDTLASDLANYSVVSSGSTFTVAPF